MAITHYGTKEIHVKILLTGPQGSGKSALMKSLLRVTGSRRDAEQTFDSTLEMDADVKAFFEFLPVSLGTTEDGYHLKGHFYTLPALHVFESTIFLLLKNVDIFCHVVDSRLERFADTLQNFKALNALLASYGQRSSDLIRIFLWNKRDLPNALDVSHLDTAFNPQQAISVPCVATKDLGTEELLQHLRASALQALAKGAGPAPAVFDKELEGL